MSRSRPQLRALAVAKRAPRIGPSPQPDARLALLKDIERLAAQAKEMNLKDAAFILDVAHLDLKSRIHNVSNEELHALSQLIPTQSEQ